MHTVGFTVGCEESAGVEVDAGVGYFVVATSSSMPRCAVPTGVG